MRSRTDPTISDERRFFIRAIEAVFAFALLLAVAQSAPAQCVVNPTGETAVGLRNV